MRKRDQVYRAQAHLFQAYRAREVYRTQARYTCTHTSQIIWTLGGKRAWARYDCLVWVRPKAFGPVFIAFSNPNFAFMQNNPTK